MANKNDKLYENLYNAGADPAKVLAALGPLLVALFPAASAEPKPSGAISGPSYPPAMSGVVFLDNVRAGYAEEGIRGGRIIPDWMLQSRKKRLEAAFLVGDRYGVPRDTMEILFLLGRASDHKDIPDPNDPNPATPSFEAPWEGLENYRGMTADALIANYWIEKNAGSASGERK